MRLHTEIYPNLKSISELLKMYTKSLDSFILSSRNNWVSCNQTLGCLCLYGDNRVPRAQPRINAYEILLQHDWLIFFSWHNRFADTHSYLQLSYQITDHLLAAVIIDSEFSSFEVGLQLNASAYLFTFPDMYLMVKSNCASWLAYLISVAPSQAVYKWLVDYCRI